MQLWNLCEYNSHRPVQALSSASGDETFDESSAKKVSKIGGTYHDVVKFKSNAAWREQCNLAGGKPSSSGLH